MTSKEELRKKLFDWNKSFEDDKAMLIDLVFESVDSNQIGKLEALGLISEYKLLPFKDFVEYPKFMERYVGSGYVDRHELMSFYDLVVEEDDFKEPDTGYAVSWAAFPDICQEEAVEITYDFVKENKIIGCEYDW